MKETGAGQTIASNDNDTTIPTSAVKDYVDNASKNLTNIETQLQAQ